MVARSVAKRLEERGATRDFDCVVIGGLGAAGFLFFEGRRREVFKVRITPLKLSNVV